MIYCILGIMAILFANSKANITSLTPILPTMTTKPASYDGQIFLCDIFTNTQVYCGFTVKKPLKFRTFNDIPRQVKYLDVNLLVVNNEPWIIHTPLIFRPFSKLIKMRFVGVVKLPVMQDSSPIKMQYVNELFDLPNMRYLELRYWNLDGSDWKFPEELETLILNKCEFTRLNLTLNSNLVSINVAANNLAKMPMLSDPPPPVETLILSNNPNLEFTADEIVDLCYLKNLGLTKFNANLNKTAQICECRRLKDYMKAFDISPYDELECANDNNQCFGYSVDDLKTNHQLTCTKFEKSIDLKPPPLIPQMPVGQDSTGYGYILTIGLAVILLVSMFANMLLLAAVMSRRKGASTSVAWESPAPEATYEEEGEL